MDLVKQSYPCGSKELINDPQGFKVHLNAPVRNLTMFDLHRRADVEEVYAGVLPRIDNIDSLDSLPRIRGGEPAHFTSFESLSRLVTVAQEQGVRVHFMADTVCLPLDIQKEWVEHVSLAIEAGVSTIVVGTLVTLREAVKLVENTGVEVVVSSSMGVSTPQLAHHCADLGSNRLVVPHELLLSEIEGIIERCGIEVEVPVQTGFGVDPSRSRFSDIVGIGEGYRAGWASLDGHHDSLIGPGFLDGTGDCGFCEVPDLINMGVAAFQLSGRESPNLKQNAKVTQMYRRAIEGMRASSTMDEVMVEIDRVELTWQMGWIPRLCEQSRCRFKETISTKAYV